MYIWKIISKHGSGYAETEWMTAEDGESMATTTARVNRRIDELEHQAGVISVHLTRRTVPGI